MERLDKLLANTGRWSRREVKELVRRGQVRVDGVIAASAEQKITPAAVTVSGEPVALGSCTYLLLHKPAGVLSAARDSRQKTVLDLLPPELRRREGSLQALRLRWGAPPETLCADGVGPLSRRLTKKQLMRLCEMLGKFAQECEWNVAVGQVLGAVAAEWEEIL